MLNNILYDYHSFWSVDYRSFQDLTPLKIALFIGDDDAGAFKVPNMIGDLDHYLLFPNGIIVLFNVGRWPLRPRKTKRSPACGSRPRSCCTCSAGVFMPRRMSVTPVASRTRTPLGTGIIASPEPRSPAPAPRSRRIGRRSHGDRSKARSPCSLPLAQTPPIRPLIVGVSPPHPPRGLLSPRPPLARTGQPRCQAQARETDAAT